MTDVNVLSARAVALREELTVQQRREILEMLGLVDVGGREVLPGPTRGFSYPATMNRVGRGATKNPDDPRVPSRHSAAPEGLRASPGAARDTRQGAGGGRGGR